MSELELDGASHETASETNYSEPPLNQERQSGQVPGGPIHGVLIGVLVGLKDDGRTPLVTFSGQRKSGAVAARSTIDLHGAHVGSDLVLMFEACDPMRPIVMGFLSRQETCQTDRRPGHVDVDADGERLVISAKEQLVLRCGKATITLTKTGKVLIQGTYISSRSSGVNRIKGGSLQLN